MLPQRDIPGIWTWCGPYGISSTWHLKAGGRTGTRSCPMTKEIREWWYNSSITMMELIYLPFQVFLLFPPLAFIVAGVFLALFLKIRKRQKSLNYLLLITVLCWLIYGLWEIRMHYWSKTVIAPIRVDLLLIIPLLYLVSIAGFLSYYRLRKN